MVNLLVLIPCFLQLHSLSNDCVVFPHCHVKSTDLFTTSINHAHSMELKTGGKYNTEIKLIKLYFEITV
jgi:hypothetical protein